MKHSVFNFVEFETTSEQRQPLLRVLEKIRPQYTRWLRRVQIDKDRVHLVYNINTPTEKWLKKELIPLLREVGLPTEIDAVYIRPGELAPDAREFLNMLKDRLANDSKDLSWVSPKEMAALNYLAQYRFVCLDFDNEILGFDHSYSTVLCKSWLAGISVTEAEGEQQLKRWMDE